MKRTPKTRVTLPWRNRRALFSLPAPDLSAYNLPREVAPGYYDPEPETGRRLVTVGEWDKRPDSLVDEYAYWYNPTDAEYGLDPWRVVDGIDPPADDAPAGTLYDVWFASGHSRACTPDHLLYVTATHYAVLFPDRKPE